MPITIQVMGFARSAAVKLHTDDISGSSAPFANRNPALSSLNAAIAFVTTRPTPPTTAAMVPAAIKKPPMASTTSMITRTSSWFSSIQEPTFVSTFSPVDIRSLTVGSSELPMDSFTFWICCVRRWNRSGSVSLIADAISVATPVPEPRASYMPTMLSWRSPTLLYIRSMRATASVSPKAFCSSIFSAASIVSPNLPRRMSRISGIDRS